ncbi:NAD-dependent epimerase/dehydratase family protein [Dactylosporangium sucinum]|uniref:NAD-dependent dehydratase n=1 Tax=Dactylosporangium sucinum TaxID=1424081 RepID=A0A917UG55_9ACTN|nr:SDR family oxidoreductase [Dactylosporangium sucinum]GGM86912.1 NAD-dependent dehydratase [Dactylosporangium sucinum]
MRVFLTGNEGYLGAVLQEELTAEGHEVTGGDSGLFTPHCERQVWDVRDVTAEELRGYDAVVHLAGLSNDAAGELSADATVDINESSSIRLARLARTAGVERLVFASSCSVYGASAEPNLTEDCVPQPLTTYARSKLAAERAIMATGTDAFHPVALRFATLFGSSPAFRNDLLVNRMVSTAWRYGQISVTGDGGAVRPLLHVRDAASAVARTLAASVVDVHGTVFNVGVPGANYSIRAVAELVQARFPGARIVFAGSPDRRSYAVCFDRFTGRITTWRPRRTVTDGIAEVADALDRSAPFPRLGSQWGRGERSSWLSLLRQEDVLTGSFRWNRLAAVDHIPPYAA